MNKFESFLFPIAIMLVFTNVILLFFLEHDQNFFSESMYCTVPLLIEIDRYKLGKECVEKDNNGLFLIKKSKQDINDYFFHCMFISFGGDCVVFSKFLDVFSLDKVMEKINDCKKIVVNKLMHRSFCVLHSDLIENTAVVLELKSEINTDQILWVIQLGAFKNFEKVSEIVNKLKKYNYPVYISPEYPKLEELVRVFIGPCSSKKHLEYMLFDLYHLTHLSGRIYLYSEYSR